MNHLLFPGVAFLQIEIQQKNTNLLVADKSLDSEICLVAGILNFWPALFLLIFWDDDCYIFFLPVAFTIRLLDGMRFQGT